MINFSAQDLINQQLKTEDDERLGNEKEITSWHCSGFGSCLTGRYLARLGIPADEGFDQRTLRVFSVGTMFEDWALDKAEKALSEAQISLTRQVRVEDKELGLSGYVDAVFTLPNGQQIPYELKSKQSKAFWYMDKKGEGAMRQHQMQLWLYLFMLKQPEGRILYISKDDQATLEYPVFLEDQKLAEETLSELFILNEAMRRGLPPQPIDDKKDWRHKYCRWHKKCLAQPKYLNLDPLTIKDAVKDEMEKVGIIKINQ